LVRFFIAADFKGLGQEWKAHKQELDHQRRRRPHPLPFASLLFCLSGGTCFILFGECGPWHFRREKLMDFNPISFCQTFQSGQAQITFPANFDKLVKFIRKVRRFRKLLLRNVVQFSQFTQSKNQPLADVVWHSARMAFQGRTKHPPLVSVSRLTKIMGHG